MVRKSIIRLIFHHFPQFFNSPKLREDRAMGKILLRSKPLDISGVIQDVIWVLTDYLKKNIPIWSLQDLNPRDVQPQIFFFKHLIFNKFCLQMIYTFFDLRGIFKIKVPFIYLLPSLKAFYPVPSFKIFLFSLIRIVFLIFPSQKVIFKTAKNYHVRFHFIHFKFTIESLKMCFSLLTFTQYWFLQSEDNQKNSMSIVISNVHQQCFREQLKRRRRLCQVWCRCLHCQTNETDFSSLSHMPPLIQILLFLSQFFSYLIQFLYFSLSLSLFKIFPSEISPPYASEPKQSRQNIYSNIQLYLAQQGQEYEMEKLKVYLQKQNRSNKTAMERIKHKIIHNHSDLPLHSSHQQSTLHPTQHSSKIQDSSLPANQPYHHPYISDRSKNKIDGIAYHNKKKSVSQLQKEEKQRVMGKKNRSYSNSQMYCNLSDGEVFNSKGRSSDRRYYPSTESKNMKSSNIGNSSNPKLIISEGKNIKNKEKNRSYNQEKHIIQRKSLKNGIMNVGSHKKLHHHEKDLNKGNYSHSVYKIIQAYKKDKDNDNEKRVVSFSNNKFDEFMKKIKPLHHLQISDEGNLQKSDHTVKSMSKSSYTSKGKQKIIKTDHKQHFERNKKAEVDDLQGEIIIKKRSKSAKEGKKNVSHQVSRKNAVQKEISQNMKPQRNAFSTSKKQKEIKSGKDEERKKKIIKTSGSSTEILNKNDEKKKSNHHHISLSKVQISGNNTKQIKKVQSHISFNVMFRTRKGIQIHNPNKVNQDRYIIKEKSQVNNKTIDIFAVADGHGPLGHCVSHTITENLVKKIENYLLIGKNIGPSLHKSYSDLQNIFQKNLDFNAQFSGSTLVSVIIQNRKKVICANVGDSRAIVARQVNKHNWEVIRLSDDHKPNRDSQKRRILAAGGRIEKVRDEDGNAIGPWRVWLPRKQLQGLAMSRSLGDNVSKPIGVTHQPQILTHELDQKDKFILIASDGVWEFLTNYQILTLLIPFYRNNRLEEACDALLKAAYQSWTVDDNSVVDDITFILIFLSHEKMQKQQEKGKNLLTQTGIRQDGKHLGSEKWLSQEQKNEKRAKQEDSEQKQQQKESLVQNQRF